jgi:hypothetical protein
MLNCVLDERLQPNMRSRDEWKVASNTGRPKKKKVKVDTVLELRAALTGLAGEAGARQDALAILATVHEALAAQFGVAPALVNTCVSHRRGVFP